MCTTYNAISTPSPPGPKMMFLPYQMLLTIIFASFDALVYRLEYISAGAINTGFIKLMHLQEQLDIDVVPPAQPRAPFKATHSTSHPIPPSIGPSSSQPSSSFPPSFHFFSSVTFLTSTLLRLKVCPSNHISTNPFSPINLFFIILLVHPLLTP